MGEPLPDEHQKNKVTAEPIIGSTLSLKITLLSLNFIIAPYQHSIEKDAIIKLSAETKQKYISLSTANDYECYK